MNSFRGSGVSRGVTWRLLVTPPLAGAANMAIDLALMSRARATGEHVLRTYEWSRPTLSLGRNQTARGMYALAELESRGIDVVRRPTGGRAILHWHEVTYSVTAPCDELGSLADDYRRINGVIIRALALLGAAAELADSAAATRQPDASPCFAEPAPGEIVVHSDGGARKVVGSAQYRSDGALLQHGSVLLQDDQPLLLELTGGNGAHPRAGSLSAALGRPVGAREVADAMCAAVGELLDPGATALEFGEVLPATAAYEAMFRDPLWTWRR